MRVLIACEESQTSCIAFRQKGHVSFSCDIQECSGGHPEWHIKDDVCNILYDQWDLVIAHPPCTYLAKSGINNLYHKDTDSLNAMRMLKVIEARDFFYMFYNYGLRGHRICIENPLPHRFACLPPYSQCVQPYWFGDFYSKYTCLWLFNLPPLMAKYGYEQLRSIPGVKSWTGTHSGSIQRSKSFPGISAAMAEQWGSLK